MSKTSISEFREAVYQKVVWRPAAILDLVDALTIAGHVSSPVALSESPLFRRKFSSVYDALVHGELDDDLKTLFSDSQDADWETIGGYEIHAIDATPNERMAAETLADRGALKAQQKEPVRYGHKYSWLVRLVQSGTSWVAPEDIERIGTDTTDTKVAAQQVKDLAVRNQRAKVITADSRYRDKHFLGAFASLENTFALVRLQNNQNLSQEPIPKPKGSRGAPRKHGADFPLTAIEREPDTIEEFFLGKQKVRVRLWHKLHFKRLANVQGSVVCIEFLQEDGTPRYKRPLWLFWTGPEDVTPQDLCRMYLWRFAIEIVCTQLTKARVFTIGAGWDNITDLYFFIIYDHSIDQQFYQLPALFKIQIVEGRLNTMAKFLDVICQCQGLNLLFGLLFQLSQLLLKTILGSSQFLTFAFKLIAHDNFRQVNFQEPLLLTFQAC